MKAESLISPGLLASQLKRFWPLGLVYGVVCGMLLVMPAFSLAREVSSVVDLRQRAATIASLWSFGLLESLFIVFAASIIVAVCMNEHLFSARAATFYGALPLRRRAVFATDYLAGFVGLMAVPALVGLMFAVLHLVEPLFSWCMVGEWCALAIALTLAFYSLAQLSCQLAGTRAVAVLLYVVANILIACIETALLWIVSLLQYGMSARGLSFEWASPIIWLADRGLLDEVGGGLMVNWAAVVPYCLAAIAFVAAASALHGRRQLEMAGEAVAWPALRPVLKYLAGVSLGLFLAMMVGCFADSSFRYGGVADLGQAVRIAAALAAGCAVGVVLAEMIMSRSTHVLGRCWKGSLALACASAVFVGGCYADVLGIASRVPVSDAIEGVLIAVDGQQVAEVKSPEAIDRAVALHHAILEYGGDDARSEEASASTIDLHYNLRNGQTLDRSYSVVDRYFVLAPAEVDDSSYGGEATEVVDTTEGPGSALLKQVAAIANTEEGLRSRYGAVLDASSGYRYELELYTDDGGGESAIRIPSSQVVGFIDEALVPDIMKHHGGDFDPTRGWSESSTAIRAELRVYDRSENNEARGEDEAVIMDLWLDERTTPSTIAWFKERYPALDESVWEPASEMAEAE